MALLLHGCHTQNGFAHRVIFMEHDGIEEDATKYYFLGTPCLGRTQLLLSKILQH